METRWLYLRTQRVPEISGTHGNPLIIENIPACGDLQVVKQTNPLLEAVVSIQSFIEETAAVRKIDERRLGGALARSAQR